MTITYGVIGCGNIARFHFAGMQKAKARAKWACDLQEEAAKPYVNKYQAAFTPDYRRILDDPEVDAVVVGSATRTHAAICCDAIAAGKVVLCEKTMANSAGEAKEIVHAVQQAKTLFFVSYMKRFFPAAAKAKELLPRLGRLFSAHVRSYQPWGNFYERNDISEFAFVFEGYGGAVLKCAGSHMIDTTIDWLGRPERVLAHVDYVENTQFDRKATAIFEYPNGLTVSFETATHPLKRIGFARDAWDEFIEVNGINGRLRLSFVTWDEPERHAPLLVHYDNATGTSTEYRFEPVNPFDLQAKHFSDCIRQGQPGRPDVMDGMNVDVVIDAIVQSAKAGQAVDVDYTC